MSGRNLKDVPNVGVEERLHPRRSRLCLVKSTEATTHRTATLAHNSSLRSGPRLYNAIPKAIRNIRGVFTDSFKGHLDKWLATLTDESPIPDYISTTTDTGDRGKLQGGAKRSGCSGGPPRLNLLWTKLFKVNKVK